MIAECTHRAQHWGAPGSPAGDPAQHASRPSKRPARTPARGGQKHVDARLRRGQFGARHMEVRDQRRVLLPQGLPLGDALAKLLRLTLHGPGTGGREILDFRKILLREFDPLVLKLRLEIRGQGADPCRMVLPQAGERQAVGRRMWGLQEELGIILPPDAESRELLLLQVPASRKRRREVVIDTIALQAEAPLGFFMRGPGLLQRFCQGTDGRHKVFADRGPNDAQGREAIVERSALRDRGSDGWRRIVGRRRGSLAGRQAGHEFHINRKVWNRPGTCPFRDRAATVASYIPRNRSASMPGSPSWEEWEEAEVMIRPNLILSAAFLWSGPVRSEIALQWPVDCRIGETCEIQHYVDHGSGSQPQDYRCGTVTYKGHNGTDIRLLSMDREQAGVSVLAAAPGRVLRTRDDMADVSVRVIGEEAVKGRDCGNGLVIAHDDGFETQYCHMRRGSLLPKPGDIVAAGQKLGLVGLSGDTEFPHLHITVRHNGEVVDPFSYGEVKDRCQAGASLWDKGLRGALSYKNGTVLNSGYVDHQVSMEDIESGLPQPSFTASTPALIAVFRAISLRAGDVQRIVFSGPTGTIEREAPPLPNAKDQVFFSLGRKRPAAGWPAGTYTAHYSIIRDGGLVTEATTRTDIAR